jgi:hypothetical protein
LRPPKPHKPEFWSLTALFMGLVGFGLAATIAMMAQG